MLKGGILMRRFIPSLSALTAFEASARHKSFTKAGEDIGITQSGVSRQVNMLEDYLGVHLFERSGSRLVLTQLGASYYKDAATLLDKLEEVSIDVVRGRKASSSLIIGGGSATMSCWLAPRLSRFPGMEMGTPMEIRMLGADVDFANGDVDIAVLRGGGQWPDARAFELFNEELAVVAAPSLVPVGERLSHLNFAALPTLQNSSRPSLWLTWLRLTKTGHSGVIQGLRFANSDMLIAAALNGLGLAIVPLHVVQPEIASGRLHLPFGPAVSSLESYWIVHSVRKARLPSIIAFRDWLLRETAADRKRQGITG